MLDKQSSRIIKYLNKLCDDESYKVFELKQLCRETKQNKDSLTNNIKQLKLNEYIDVKYEDKEVVCLCLLSKARQVEEQSSSKLYGLSVITKTLLISGIFNAIMAFLGAFAAFLIIR